MDDIDTRLEAERPEVADALRSMNWDERLAEARARRKAVLEKTDKADRRPVVRIVDAAAMARRRASAPAQPGGEATETPIPAAPVVILPPAVLPGPASGGALAPVSVVRETGRGSLAGRTAVGFGLGLGLGTSLIAGAFLLFVLPDARLADTPPAPPSTAAMVAAPVADAGVVAPSGDASASGLPPALLPPLGAAETPSAIVAPAAEAAASARPETAAPPPARSSTPALPAVLAAERPFGTAAPLPAPILAAFDVALRPTPASVAVAAVLPLARPFSAPSAARPSEPPPVQPDAVPGREAGPLRPGPALSPEAIAAAPPAATETRLPGSAAPPVLAALPVRPFALAAPLPALGAVPVPPAPPDIPSAGTDVQVPNGEGLFVRIAVPETVPDAEAEELAGLLRTVGIGDGRITRVGFKVSDTHLRFYHAGDAVAAAALADIVGTEARDFTSFRPRPPDGTLELFVAGDRTSPPPRAAAPKRSATPNRARAQPPDDLTRMRDRIVNRMRRGEHL